MQKKAEEVSNKIIDVNKFVLEFLDMDPKKLKEISYKVSYHDPCHGVRGLKIKNEPRELLRKIPGVEFVEMHQADWCCGGAGSYCFLQEENSEKILEIKLANFKNTGATVLATSCPACTMQLGYGLRDRKMKAKILHPMQILAEAIS